ncbi:MAG: RIP metalloprotease RseP [Cyclobacteriaceae bacterium]|nr:RIP metalloprotease RseP [Cyclobacteriaceae bacterium]MCH8515001.1 RIP metalloprotease RseP [Cyclobacteriaceae bacterium]
MDGLIMAAQILLSLSILVGLHEFGHLIAAKYFGMRVEKFSIGFPPKLFGVKWGETEYSIGAIPLGGFVKITGMVDESMDTDQLKSEPKDYEFRSKPAWQRLIVMMAGIIFNVILGIAIFIGIVSYYGDTYWSTEAVNKSGVTPNELGKAIGFERGDQVIAINGEAFEAFNDIYNAELIMDKGTTFTVLRDGEEVTLQLPEGFMKRYTDERDAGPFIEPLFPFEIGATTPGGGAEKAGLQSGDKILSIDGIATPYFNDIKPVLEDKKGEEVEVLINRGGEELSKTVKVSDEGLLGFQAQMLLEPSKVNYSIAEAIPKGTSQAFGVTILNIKGMGKVFSGEVSTKNISGPIGIAKFFGGTWDWNRFWFLTGMLSMWLAFINFLPIPALDGGHVAFLTYEIISGRPPAQNFLEGAQKVGMILLLLLMVFILFNDVINLIFT